MPDLPRLTTLELFEEVPNGVALRCALEQLIDAHADPKESEGPFVDGVQSLLRLERRDDMHGQGLSIAFSHRSTMSS